MSRWNPRNILALVMHSKTVEVKYYLPSRGALSHVVINATNLKVYGEGERKTRKHGKDTWHIWRNLHLAVDVFPHEVITT